METLLQKMTRLSSIVPTRLTPSTICCRFFAGILKFAHGIIEHMLDLVDWKFSVLVFEKIPVLACPQMAADFGKGLHLVAVAKHATSFKVLLRNFNGRIHQTFQHAFIAPCFSRFRLAGESSSAFCPACWSEQESRFHWSMFTWLSTWVSASSNDNDKHWVWKRLPHSHCLVGTTLELSLNWQWKPYAQVAWAICRCNADDDTPLPPCGLPSIDASSMSRFGLEIVVFRFFFFRSILRAKTCVKRDGWRPFLFW